jgi:LPPG:FO 2-phospho-L-lactate transferase
VVRDELNIVALAGGVGGAKLADGLAQVLQPEHLTIIVNTGDDFTHFGLRISPDLDTVCYTLAGMANPETGWGRNNDTWRVLDNLKKMGMADWFQLGDADIATHLVRTIRLNEGISLSQITSDFCKAWGVKVKVLPMSDDVVQTWVYTNEGTLEFQEYFVHRHSEPLVNGFKFEGIERSKPAPGVLEAIDQCDAVVICPSNPWVSIDPILSVPKTKAAVEKHPVYGVSPIIGNQTLKGPAAKMFSELGIQPSALAVAQHYEDLMDGILIDESDNRLVGDINKLGIQSYVTKILMHDQQDRGRLAKEIINVIQAKLRG